MPWVVTGAAPGVALEILNFVLDLHIPRSECVHLFYRVHRIRVGTYNAALHIIVNIQVHTSDRKNIVK